MAGREAGTHELLVVASDRPGLLSWIAGSVALAGLSILRAPRCSTDDGVVDLFEVEGFFEEEIGEPRWREFRGMLRKAVGELASRPQGRREACSVPGTAVDRAGDRRGRHRRDPTTRRLSRSELPTVSAFCTTSRARSQDSRSMCALRVATYTGRVIDAFYVRDALERKVTDPTQVSEIRPRFARGSETRGDTGNDAPAEWRSGRGRSSSVGWRASGKLAIEGQAR